ncbi:oxysterol binding family protein [Heterostelium album PN500]|uniref:Oxysterol binding family protein n=1 Tax=Heterostelium pallidum (strain ATCC 26659 / Pp 5 / PN500) TaxID=670386 RepID=D3BK86_HETP5|nr:oxysterol binding family protein [Heterostelium album PN500]EFA78316.1 oxysterol binding family protein [Heterostelium album PN500]|eukprot:XP_020430441.1 oxysterol binding family protein [Heterostelium album PN500]
MSFIKRKLGKKDKGGESEAPMTEAQNDEVFKNIDFGKEGEGNEPPEDKKKLWSKVSGLIGKDTMSLVSLPVYFFEPLTVLESQVEPLRFVHFIEKACTLENSMDRMVYITAFNISLFSSYVRTAKPFNPLLGETYEYIPKSGNYRTFCEQVSHHPPIGVAETSSDKFNLQQESWITTKFWGNSVDIFSIGNNHLYLNDFGDHYTWKVPQSCCHNIIIGKMWIEHHGQMTITNHKTGEKAVLNFQKSGWFDGTTRKVNGEIFDSNGRKRFLVSGRWNEYIVITKLDDHGVKFDEFTIWKAENDPAVANNKWKLGTFLQSLNEMTPEYEKILPPTDSRLRSDRRYLEMQENKIANKEKNRIEEKEREKRRERERTGQVWTPRYFKKVDDPVFGYRWLFNGEYWKERNERIRAFESQNNISSKLSSMSLTDESISTPDTATSGFSSISSNDGSMASDGFKGERKITYTTTNTNTAGHSSH